MVEGGGACRWCEFISERAKLLISALWHMFAVHRDHGGVISRRDDEMVIWNKPNVKADSI